jgi:hypothetical protein
MTRMTIRDLGYSPGQLSTGPKNSILDVKGEQKTYSIPLNFTNTKKMSESAK